MREKGKKKARLPLDQRTARQLIGNMSRAPSDLLVSDQEILHEGAQTDGLVSIF
jgi:hypothetical protein